MSIEFTERFFERACKARSIEIEKIPANPQHKTPDFKVTVDGVEFTVEAKQISRTEEDIKLDDQRIADGKAVQALIKQVRAKKITQEEYEEQVQEHIHTHCTPGDQMGRRCWAALHAAQRQLSKGNMNAVVIYNDTSDNWTYPERVIAALAGTPQVQWTKRHDTGEVDANFFNAGNAFFNAKANTRIGALITIFPKYDLTIGEEELRKIVHGTQQDFAMDVYINPYAENPIPREVLERFGDIRAE
jgi:hypothetical protein